jgi:hypothetical protein
MPNAVKYKAGNLTGSLQKGNVALGISGSLGPTSTTGWYNGPNPPTSGLYQIIETAASGDPEVYSPQNDAELIRFARWKGATGANTGSAAAVLAWIGTQTNLMAANFQYESIVTDGLVLNLDAGFVGSYPTTASIWYDLSGNNNNGTLINGPTFSTDGGGSIVFDGVDDYSRIEFNTLFNGSSSDSFSIEIIFKRNSLVYGNADSLYQMGTGGLTNARIYFWFDDNSNGSMAINYFTQSGVLNGDRYVVLDSQLDDLNYHHAVQIVNKETSLMTGYWDGINKGSGGIISNSFTSDVYFDIAGQNYCDATIGIVRIYNRALTSSEVLQNYNAQKGRFGL